MKHIAFLTPEYPHPLSKRSGGLGTSIKNLAVEFTNLGIKVSVFIYGQETDKIVEAAGIELHFIAQKQFKFFGWYRYRKLLQNYLNTYIKKNSIQLMEAPDWTGITAFIKLKCPKVIRCHGSDAYFCHLEHRKQKVKNYWFEKLALKQADYVIAVSSFTAKLTKEIFKLRKEIEVIHNGINTNLFLPSNNPVNKNEILYFGTIIRKKGVLQLAEIFNRIAEANNDAYLRLVGKDVNDIFENVSTISLFQNKLTAEAKKRFEYIPEVSYDTIQSYISQAAVIVLPSYAEAFPMSWLEAMALKKALVTSNIGWAAELMKSGETGFTEHPENYAEFALKVLTLLDDPELAKKMGEAARQEVLDHFSAKVIAKQNVVYYNRILNL